jgi:predicted small lipoprotein YifL
MILRPTFRSSSLVISLAVVASVAGCGSKNDSPPADKGCSVDAQTGCNTGQVCETVEGGKTGCFAPISVEGKVISTADAKGIGGARVVARDVAGALASREVAISAADGTYKLTFPATRKADGTPAIGAFSLRADAAGFATFPSGLRVALPVDVTAPAKAADGSYSIKNASTDIGLDPRADAASLGSVSGTVKGNKPGGTLVVAGAMSGIAAPDGTYTIFNVAAGALEVRGYLQGLQLKPANATVTAGAETKGVDLLADTGALGSVTGGLEFVNAGSSNTTVVLVVKSTFDTNLGRGEVPRGLRAANVSGSYEIKDVPAGQYVVLAAFENDGLVRDPDTSIGGTATQEITVGNAAASVPSFKITGALDVISPGATAAEPVTGTPSFVWKDDSSEDGYRVVVYDTFGKLIWEKPDVPLVTGSGNVTQAYGGPALTPGYYQFRAYSWRDKKGGTGGKTYISATEDLKGVFIVK